MFKFLLCTLMISNVMGDIFSPPSCLNNYTTFMDQVMNYSNTSLITNHTSITALDCSNYCNNNINCTSFNYSPTLSNKDFESKCDLLNLTFNSTMLNDSFDSAYYLKSQNDCSSQKRMLTVLYVAIGLIVLLIIGCCVCGCRKRRQEYSNI